MLAGFLLLVNASCNVAFVVVFDFGTAGLAAATSISALGNATLLAVGMRRHAPAGSGLPAAWLRALLSAAVMSGCVLACQFGSEQAGLATRILGRLALPIVVGILTYVLTQALLKSPELAAVRRRR